MMRSVLRIVFLAASSCLVLAGTGCTLGKHTRTYKEPPPPDIKSTVIDYVDADGFDTLLESALTYQDPVIVIQTTNEKPDWEGRLNAWIAAWNMGGRVEGDKPRARMQAPFSTVPVDGNSIKEFRILVESLMGRVEGLAKTGTAWWQVERIKKHRIELLRPYNLRFHVDSDDHIQIILFNGRYAQYHREFVQAIAQEDGDNGAEWGRVVCCSRCKNCRQTSRPVARPARARLEVDAIGTE